MNITISNIINYLKSDVFTIITLKKKAYSTSSVNNYDVHKLSSSPTIYNAADYGLTDMQVVQAASSNFIAYNAATRIIFPNNYASSGVKTIMAVNDYDIPSEMPISSLQYTFSSPQLNCNPQVIAFNKTISISCDISTSGSANFSINLIDTKLASSPLTSYSQSIYIYPQPQDHCSNVMCDVCSTGPSGK